MAAVDADPRPAATHPGPVPPRHRPSGRVWDIAAVVVFVGAAVLVTGAWWDDLPGRALGVNRQDQAFFEWMLAHGARVVTHLENPLITSRLNMPDGVNLMANTSILGLSIPLAPLTLLLGPNTTFVILMAVVFAATGIAWYHVLSRHIVTSRAAALLGAAFCAFAPGMVSHGNGHPNIVGQFLVPFLVWWTVRLAEPGRAIRNGVILGVLVVWQAFINEEILLLTALGLGIFVVVMAGLRPAVRRGAAPFLRGLGVTAAVAGLLLAVPLWVQFAGPGAYHGLRPDIRQAGADLASYFTFAGESLAGDPIRSRAIAPNATEENAFLGWPLLILLAGVCWWMRRNAVIVALAVVGAVFAVASLGPTIRWYGEPIGPGPMRLVNGWPILNSIVPGRFALAVVPVIGVMLALAWDRWRAAASQPGAGRLVRYAIPVATAVALLPILPTPLPELPRDPAPVAITDGSLARRVPDDRSVVFVPPPRNQGPDPMMWAARAGLGFRLTHGYFIGPLNDPARPLARHGIFTAPPRPTSDLMYAVEATGVVPPITDRMRRQAIDDLMYWRAGVLVLAPHPNEDSLRALVTGLVGFEPERLGGLWLWDVRQIATR